MPAPQRSALSRRELLAGAGVALGAVALAGCGGAPDRAAVPTAPPPEDTVRRHRPARDAVLRGVNSFTLLYADTVAGFPGEPQSSYDFLAGRGQELIRLPFRWGTLQPQLAGALEPTFLESLRREVRRVGRAGMKVVLDLHTSGHWPRGDSPAALGSGITEAQFADVWLRLSALFKDDPTVIAYDLVNEPSVEADVWERYSQACVSALRGAGDAKLLWIEAVDYSGPEVFAEEHGGPWIDDPAGNLMYSAHQYFERAGRYERGFEFSAYADQATGALERLGQFTDWLAEHDLRGSVGEIGWPSRRRTDSWAQWNALGERWYEAADAAGLWVTYFSATSAFDELQNAYDAPENRLEPIPGISVAESQAAVIEAHPSRSGSS